MNSEPASSYDGLLDQDMFEAVFASANTIRVDIHEAAGRNIKKAQEKQKRVFDPRNLSSTNVKVGDRVLLENKRRHDRKGGKFSYRLLVPCTVKALNKNGLASRKPMRKPILLNTLNMNGLASRKPMRKPMLHFILRTKNLEYDARGNETKIIFICFQKRN